MTSAKLSVASTHIRCIRSFSASSRSVWIQPQSRLCDHPVSLSRKGRNVFVIRTISRRLRRCRRAAATIPGTAAILSRKRIRYEQSVRIEQGGVYEKAITYLQPLRLVHQVPITAKVIQRQLLGIGWKRLVLVTRSYVEAPSDGEVMSYSDAVHTQSY